MKQKKSPLSTWQDFRQRTIQKIELLTPAELTRLSWARLIESPAAVPESYRPYLEAHTRGCSAFPLCILTPTLQGFLHQETEKLVFMVNNTIHILEKTREGLQPASFSLDDIDRVELGVILLKAWLTISGCDHDGTSKTVTLRFNAVNDRLFYPIIEAIRSRHKLIDEFSGVRYRIETERARFDDLEKDHFKFMNYARRSLQPGEHVLGFVFQPEMRRTALALFGKAIITRPLSPEHLFVLTDQETILIRDDPESLKGCDDSRYGGVWHFIDRQHLAATNIKTDPFGNCLLALTMRNGTGLEILFSQEQYEELSALIEAMRIGHTALPI